MTVRSFLVFDIEVSYTAILGYTVLYLQDIMCENLIFDGGRVGDSDDAAGLQTWYRKASKWFISSLV